MHIIIDAEAFRGQRSAEFRHIVDGLGQQPDHGGIQLLPLQIGDIEVDHHRIGADHLFDKMLIELSAFPVFQIN